MRILAAGLAIGLAASSWTGVARAQDDPVTWSQGAARGILQVCIEDGPDAARVAEHAEVWGWPPFKGYLEHPEGFRRQAGGESRRDFQSGEQTAFVEATVQSGVVTAAAPADVTYFRCNIDSDRSIGADLETFLTGLYGPPVVRDSASEIWLGGAAKGSDPTEAAVLKAISAAAPGSSAAIVELGPANGHDEAKLTIFRNGPAD